MSKLDDQESKYHRRACGAAGWTNLDERTRSVEALCKQVELETWVEAVAAIDREKAYDDFCGGERITSPLASVKSYFMAHINGLRKSMGKRPVRTSQEGQPK